MRRCKFTLATAALAICATTASAEEPLSPEPAINNAPVVELKGRLVRGPERRMNFRAGAGPSYELRRNKLSEALFVDTNFQAKTLLLKGRVVSNHIFEVTGNLRSLHNGTTNELYYYCDICAVQQIDPGPCMCCRDPVVLTEEPVK